MSPTAPTDALGCLALAQRQIGDASGWTDQQWADQLADDSVQRGDPATSYFRPYRTALAYLLRPDRVQARTEGDTSEQYVQTTATATRLQDLDAEWASRIPPEATPDAGEWSGDIEWGGW
ncbi:hypothetical protein CBQ26_09130 [Deinococcus indicus]|uniref:Uncharacterized protein n=1 Tax=Deinococcus indicus TaxID=223556 RepID=A0A2D0A7Z1_9DEIO|nr:hypothetical protein [Deinococcus indicus]OWL96529.1 hypothetical protein CBQ26_09130 [Deinococcus indicus]